jgi:hypothetical protein
MYDENNKTAGLTVLDMLKREGYHFHVIIYTNGRGTDSPDVRYSDHLPKYTFICGRPILKPDIEDLQNRILTTISSSHCNKNSLYAIDKDDFHLTAAIKLIGESNFSSILYKIKYKNGLTSPFSIGRMSSGFSGAALYKLMYDGKTEILKISNDKEMLKKEYKNSQVLYKKFPSKFRIEIGSPFETEHSFAILIENVHAATTLFDWLGTKPSKKEVNDYFKNLYDSTNGMAYSYKSNQEYAVAQVKFTQIFNVFEKNFAWIASAIKELKPIIDNYEMFDENSIKNLVVNGNYKNIDKDKLTDDKYKKHKILCHGDFHSSNIMCQNTDEDRKDPILIDTGGMRYDYWCMDICRLIVHLFIVGLDKETLKYFDIGGILNNLNIAQKIIKLEEISEDTDNKGYIYAINWLISNAETIYNDLFCKWEFQLGLCKEFLQMAYRVNSIPPNKRALALLSAYQCMEQANASFC